MSKAVVIGIIIAVIIGIIIVSSSISMETTNDENELGFEDIIEAEVVEESGRDLSVELEEKMPFKTP